MRRFLLIFLLIVVIVLGAASFYLAFIQQDDDSENLGPSDSETEEADETEDDTEDTEESGDDTEESEESEDTEEAEEEDDTEISAGNINFLPRSDSSKGYGGQNCNPNLCWVLNNENRCVYVYKCADGEQQSSVSGVPWACVKNGENFTADGDADSNTRISIDKDLVGQYCDGTVRYIQVDVFEENNCSGTPDPSQAVGYKLAECTNYNPPSDTPAPELPESEPPESESEPPVTESEPECGDGTKNGDEACDSSDENDPNKDSCTDDCQLRPRQPDSPDSEPECGDDNLDEDLGEECEPALSPEGSCHGPNTIGPGGEDLSCLFNECGDGVVTSEETCDPNDPDDANADTCNINNCTYDPVISASPTSPPVREVPRTGIGDSRLPLLILGILLTVFSLSLKFGKGKK